MLQLFYKKVGLNMEIFEYQDLSGLKWEHDNPSYIVVISHGMAEHIERYDYFANKLVADGACVFGLNQIGHGKKAGSDLGHWNPGDFNNCVERFYQLILLLKERFPNLPIILFGHSMGSYLSQQYIKVYGESVSKVILSGSSKTGALHKMGKFLADFFTYGNQKNPNAFLNNLSFGSYNKPFKPNRTEFDWLSRDEKQVDKYVNDPLCGYCCTTGFFREFLTGLAKLNNGVSSIPKSLPIFILSGDKDPVGSQGKDTKKLYDMYIKNGLKNVEIKLYKNGRHEMLNEINKDEVISDIISWIHQ